MEYRYEAEWRPYAFPPQANAFASEESLKQSLTKIDYSVRSVTPSGPPVISDGNRSIYASTDDSMSISFGITGAKKTRCLVLPTIASAIHAGESLVVPDIKGDFVCGEHSAFVRGMLDKYRYEVHVIDFRTKAGDGYNILAEPYRLYKKGDTDTALEMNSDIVKTLGRDLYAGTKADPFWESSSNCHLRGVIPKIYKYCNNISKVNFLSVASFLNEDNEDALRAILNYENDYSLEAVQLRSVLAQPDKTRASTAATSMTFIEPFLINRKLLQMLSQTTFEVRNLYRKKMCLFIMLPDENPTYDTICGIILQQINATLLQDATDMGGRLPRRVNFICDEFCNYKIPNMAANISASRSRNIRWLIICQSQQQLRDAYPREAATIIANCQNLFFFNSMELSLLDELSRRAGTTTVTYSGAPEPLISVQDLQRLKKTRDYAEVLYMSRGVFYVSRLADIACYRVYQSMPQKKYGIPSVKLAEVSAFTPQDMLKAASEE